MYKKTMETVDFGGTKRTEDYYFNLTAAELMEMQLSTEGGFKEMIAKIVNSQDTVEATKVFKTALCKSYGVLSPDGRKFIKNEAVLNDFLATQAYSDLYMELLTDANAATEFFNNVIPPGPGGEAQDPCAACTAWLEPDRQYGSCGGAVIAPTCKHREGNNLSGAARKLSYQESPWQDG